MESHVKKTTLYKEQDPKKVEEYQNAVKDIPPEKIAYVDESGIDSCLYREYAYAPRGEKVTERIAGRKFQRTNIVAAKLDDKILAPMQYNGTTDAPLFEFWFEQWLLPCLPEDAVIVMDNKQKTKNKEQKSKTETKNREIYIAIIAYLNQQTGSNYNPDNAQTQELIESRLKEGYTPADFAKVIDRKTREWENTEFAQYLRPSPLFGDKFENYLNAPAKPSEKEKKPDMLDEIM